VGVEEPVDCGDSGVRQILGHFFKEINWRCGRRGGQTRTDAPLH
jgi:hypothetical protein